MSPPSTAVTSPQRCGNRRRWLARRRPSRGGPALGGRNTAQIALFPRATRHGRDRGKPTSGIAASYRSFRRNGWSRERQRFRMPLSTLLSSQCRQPAGLNPSRLVLVERQAELSQMLSRSSVRRPLDRLVHKAHRIDLAGGSLRRTRLDLPRRASAGPRARDVAHRAGGRAGRLFGGGSVDLRGLCDAGEHRSGVAVHDLLARFLADMRVHERLPRPVAA